MRCDSVSSREIVRRMWAENRSVKIAAAVGLTSAWVCQIAKELGLPPHDQEWIAARRAKSKKRKIESKKRSTDDDKFFEMMMGIEK